ncbi:hypothetical protein A2422_03545 [Candidatus Woesebacteria bacterium RIFOXYC1_FULL_31_51]|uniref:Uncharacterized protein n=1 Tax=Candidatus Woesebacteria bacterium GW2011_GWC2_31_9 TaxID=1618586 RepID=A0A0G0AXG8_9BACT|nr:MAG: hypothetical protein UR17_C0001G0215 [Candidatus Woesebacteria bacterium GW2011_GWF1_31_35]KKP23288.1 MAG: hypothetical protein UR11_C0001G0262 [Candidatus Woesebacteria bacterium GW2011_GWC1_30_29]KKP26193.1 MAG: hypothetical protein UR13_C0005G0076 [Candidatus Woesebacteria bacterium GW2011_GWD1_31_12]KKP27550.1 MAG: hypothetical protein UR16_C0003G0210 [Candidatus Woesebacteria bacterium GW2011_GWB1_31_29]KKP31275.1 MAG: hypothetical protein UR21_C0012G0016 [Candidatus Woesebacteria 
MSYKTGLNIEFFEASALVGLKAGYQSENININTIEEAIKHVSERIDYIFSGTITPTKILVAGKDKNYEEDAVLIWTSIYPRFSVVENKFKESFIKFIGELAIELKQERTSINFSDESLMLETEFCKNPDLK